MFGTNASVLKIAVSQERVHVSTRSKVSAAGRPGDDTECLHRSRLSEVALSISAQDGRDPLAVTNIEPAEGEEQRFSPSADTFSAIKDLGLRLPQAFSDLVDSLLSKLREQRIQTAELVEQAITDIARGGTPSDEYLRVQHAETETLPVETRSSLPGIGAAVALVAASAMLTCFIWGHRAAMEPPSTGPTQGDDPQGAIVITDDPTELTDREPITMSVGGSPSDFPSLRAALLKVQPGDTLAVQGKLRRMTLSS